jgi:hypothetical protein
MNKIPDKSLAKLKVRKYLTGICVTVSEKDNNLVIECAAFAYRLEMAFSPNLVKVLSLGEIPPAIRECKRELIGAIQLNDKLDQP